MLSTFSFLKRKELCFLPSSHHLSLSRPAERGALLPLTDPAPALPQEEELDCQQGVIDFSLYLRASPTEETEPGGGTHDMSESKYERVLDQKNYIEELNRHLK